MHTFSRAQARTLSTCVMTLAAGSLSVALAAGASAHVNVNSTDARQGGFGKVTVRVPNERPVGTVKVSVSMPKGIVMRSVKAKPHFGWTFDAPMVKLPTPFKQGDKTVTEAVQVITWTADKGVSIKDGAFDEFEFTVGQMPTDKTSLSFPAIQTYSNGEVVSWIEPKTVGAAEPEHPAPVLELLPPKGSKTTPVAATSSDKAGGQDSLARGLGAGAAVVALGGIALGLRRKRA